MREFIVLLTFIFLMTVPVFNADAFILITEILADPAPGLAGDANNDGIISFSQDEFVEIRNIGNQDVDISGWRISDAVRTRHVLGANTILLRNQYLVIFGGGNPQLPGIFWQTASAGSLGLNNSGDVVSLLDQAGNLVNQVAYGTEGGMNSSMVLDPEVELGRFVLHSSLPPAQGALFSPGVSATGQSGLIPAVPEPASLFLFGVGMLGLAGRFYR